MAYPELLDTHGTAVEEKVIGELKDRLRGQLFRPSDDGYDAARSIWNGNSD